MTKKQLLRDAADDCVELSNYLVNDAQHMGATKELRYRAQAAECLKRAEELQKLADGFPDEPSAVLCDRGGKYGQCELAKGHDGPHQIRAQRAGAPHEN